MNNKSLREKAVLAVIGVVALYAVAVGIWFMSQEDAWKKAAKAYDKAKKTYEAERKLIGERQKWNDAYEEEKAQMPTFAFGKATDTTWQRKMDELAENREGRRPRASDRGQELGGRARVARKVHA